jgi:hypothetical protein
LCEKRTPLLRAYLRRGGSLAAFAGLEAERRARDVLIAAMDRALS